MNPHTVGDGNGTDGRPSHDIDSPTSVRIPVGAIPGRGDAESTAGLHVQHRGTTSTDLARTSPAGTLAEIPAAEGAVDGSARTGTVISGDLRLTVNAPDGSVAVPCPPGSRPQPAVVPADPSVRPRSTSGLLERDALCERLRTLLLEGRSVRLTGAHGSGRSSVLDAVALSCAGLAPSGVVRLSGHARTSADLLQDLFAATHEAPGYRPGRTLMADLLRGLCAIVVIDDIEFSGEFLTDLLAAAPESSFLLSSTPATTTVLSAALLEKHGLEEIRLPGLSRQSSLALLARLAGRPLDDTERAWAVDLWFESEGLPLRFVQAAALLRHRETAIDALAASLSGELPVGQSPHGGLGGGAGDSGGAELALARQPVAGGFEAYLSQRGQDDERTLADPVPLPSVAESAAPALRIARGLSTAGRRTLVLAAALGGECPSAPHLPALIDVGQGETAIEELVAAGLAAPAGAHFRLVDGVAALLAEEWPVETVVREAAQHFAWWTGHASVTEAQIAAEAEVLLATMHADREAGRHHQVVQLARATAPAFALALRWGAWERALRFGLESARATAAVAEEAWFHHELGVLALCVGAYDRSRAELEASVALRGALGDIRGTAAGRRALGQLEEAAGVTRGGGSTAAGGRGGAGLAGLRRVLPFQRKSVASQSLTKRQVMLAAAAVVGLGVLGAATAFGIGAMDRVDTAPPAAPGESAVTGPGFTLPPATDGASGAPTGKPSSSGSTSSLATSGVTGPASDPAAPPTGLATGSVSPSTPGAPGHSGHPGGSTSPHPTHTSPHPTHSSPGTPTQPSSSASSSPSTSPSSSPPPTAPPTTGPAAADVVPSGP